MLLAVFSDSHGAPDRMVRAVERFRPDHLVFLGDGLRDLESVERAFPTLPLVRVRGNCDGYAYAPDTPESALFELAGVRIFAAHGHRHQVKLGLDAFCNSVCCSMSALGLYGHTHAPLITRRDGVTLLNPGSIGDRFAPSCALVRLEDGGFSCTLEYLGKG